MLYLPWRNETVHLLGSHATAKQSFVFNNDCLLVLGGDQASFAAEVDLRPPNHIKRIRVDCNCLFCSFSYIITGSEEQYIQPFLTT